MVNVIFIPVRIEPVNQYIIIHTTQLLSFISIHIRYTYLLVLSTAINIFIGLINALLYPILFEIIK